MFEGGQCLEFYLPGLVSTFFFCDIDGGNAQHGGEWGLLLTIVKREYRWSIQKVQNCPGPFIAYFSRWCEVLYLDWRGVC